MYTSVRGATLTAGGTSVLAATATKMPVTGFSLAGFLVMGVSLLIVGFVLLRLGLRSRAA